MGVDCEIYLPADVRLSDVADIIAILTGRPVTWGGTADGKSHWVTIKGVKVCGIPALPQCAEINIEAGGTGVRQDRIFVLYHFEPSPPNSRKRLLKPRATAFWIAIGRRLVEFYGGTVDYNDCDETEIDYEIVARPRDENAPEDGKPWDDFQKAKAGIKPLTQDEVNAMEQFAAYH